MSRGFIIVAQNSGNINYLDCAALLCESIKKVMPNESVTLLTDVETSIPHFDYIKTFPYGDQCKDKTWKLDNDWQVYDASPYDRTIKIEADFYITRSITHWWDVLEHRDLNICTTIRNHKNEISGERFYRQFIDKNNLPDTYNGLVYFKKSDVAKTFFQYVKTLFQNWDKFKNIYKHHVETRPTTDFVYACAAQMLGHELCTMPKFTEFSFIHMKPVIINSRTKHWFEEFIYEIDNEFFRINTIPTLYPLHYHIKSFSQEIRENLNG